MIAALAGRALSLSYPKQMHRRALRSVLDIQVVIRALFEPDVNADD